MAAFVERANASIPNEKYRPDVWRGRRWGRSGWSISMEDSSGRLEIDGAHAARYCSRTIAA